MNKTDNTTKKCPSCAMDIPVKAKRCAYCRRDLRGWASRHPILTTLLLLIVLSNAILVAGRSSEESNGTPAPTKQQELNATVNFTGTQFVIENLEKYDCIGAKLSVNDSYTLDGYTLSAGHQYTVGAAQFSKGDGTRFSPFNLKPQKFTIACRGTNQLSNAFWYGEFN